MTASSSTLSTSATYAGRSSSSPHSFIFTTPSGTWIQTGWAPRNAAHSATTSVSSLNLTTSTSFLFLWQFSFMEKPFLSMWQVFPSIFIFCFQEEKMLWPFILLSFYCRKLNLSYFSTRPGIVVSWTTCVLLFHCCGVLNTGISPTLISFNIDF